MHWKIDCRVMTEPQKVVVQGEVDGCAVMEAQNVVAQGEDDCRVMIGPHDQEVAPKGKVDCSVAQWEVDHCVMLKT